MKSLVSLLRRGRGLVLPLLLIAAWEAASRQDASHAYAFVPLRRIGEGLAELLASGELWLSVAASLQRTCLGLLFGVAAGFVLGAAMALSRSAGRLLAPLFHGLRQVPILGLIPLLALWFGSGEATKVLIVSLAAFYPMALNAHEGFSHVEKRYREVGRLYALSPLQQFTQVLLPGALPSLCNGVLHALAFAWVSSVGSELFLSTGMGLGNLMMNAETGSRMEIIVIGVLCIGLLGYAMNQLFSSLARHLLRWRALRR
ncbi:ABC transporter permease [Pseudomonas citronellolis]|uniref:ABC transporter permease n=1 Tax=Pseudomonas citronellolis TaxID=53408 RepID=UPI00209CD794|nr:ABC transporter permease [Pseudomonas citronellolis]MCP1605213.1 sulfonate transport system permease protein [Pseudomonas citronellolis]MCP1656354.1 sulfonate transport system permease protein [Pseudomonas citronellolis]MCP1723227.1 sulfonate transport system permease protein [Pseudomonas citronellolis]